MMPTSEPHPLDPTATTTRWEGHVADDLGATYGPEPMASLTATDRELVLSSNRGTYQIPRTAIAKIGRGGLYPWFFGSIRIHHSVAGLPKELQFKPVGSRPRAVANTLRALGYPAR